MPQGQNEGIPTILITGIRPVFRGDGRAAIRLDSKNHGSMALEVDAQAIGLFREALMRIEEYLHRTVDRA